MQRLLPSFFRRVTWFLMLSILTSSIAMAAYLCPEIEEPTRAVEMAMDGEPCTGMDTENPVQCAQAQSGAQLALEQLASPPALTPVVIAFVHPAPLLAAPSGPPAEWTEGIPSVGIDPPYLRTQRLRI